MKFTAKPRWVCNWQRSNGVTQPVRATNRSVISIRFATAAHYVQRPLYPIAKPRWATIKRYLGPRSNTKKTGTQHELLPSCLDRRHVGDRVRWHCDTPAASSSRARARTGVPGAQVYWIFSVRCPYHLPAPVRGPMTWSNSNLPDDEIRWPDFCGTSCTKRNESSRVEVRRDDSPIGPPVVSLIPGCKRVMYAAINRNEHSRAFFRGAIFRRIYDPRHAKREMNYAKRRRCFHVVRLVSSSGEKGHGFFRRSWKVYSEMIGQAYWNIHEAKPVESANFSVRLIAGCFLNVIIVVLIGGENNFCVLDTFVMGKRELRSGESARGERNYNP